MNNKHIIRKYLITEGIKMFDDKKKPDETKSSEIDIVPIINL